jgi:hypothetical protein
VTNTVKCPGCGQEHEVPEEPSSPRVSCPSCQTTFRVDGARRSPPVGPAAAPPRPGPIRALSCPRCTKRFGAPAEALGLVIVCPHCTTSLRIEEQGPQPLDPGADGRASSAGPGHDPLAFLSAPSAAAAPAPAPQEEVDQVSDFLALLAAPPAGAAPPPARSGPETVWERRELRGSRYAARGTGRTAPGAACVIRPFYCPEDEATGQVIMTRLKELIEKEDDFSTVVISNDLDAWGSLVTVDDGAVSVAVDPGGFFRKASCSLTANAVVRLANGYERPVSAKAAQQAGAVAAMMKANAKAVATSLGNQILRATTGARHLASEISGLATGRSPSSASSCIWSR